MWLAISTQCIFIYMYTQKIYSDEFFHIHNIHPKIAHEYMRQRSGVGVSKNGTQWIHTMYTHREQSSKALSARAIVKHTDFLCYSVDSCYLSEEVRYSMLSLVWYKHFLNPFALIVVDERAIRTHFSFCFCFVRVVTRFHTCGVKKREREKSSNRRDFISFVYSVQTEISKKKSEQKTLNSV